MYLPWVFFSDFERLETVDVDASSPTFLLLVDVEIWVDPGADEAPSVPTTWRIVWYLGQRRTFWNENGYRRFEYIIEASIHICIFLMVGCSLE